MRITTVTAARLINTGNYENSRFEATAEVRPDEDPQEAMVCLVREINDMIRRERLRRYPDPERRTYAMWVEEDEIEQA